MDRVDEADMIFHSGFNCCQSVFGAYASDFGMSEDEAFKLSCGFGGGMGRTKNTCGAVTGAVMAISMKYGKFRQEDTEAKDLTYQKVRDFINEFIKENGSDNCYKLIGYDLLNADEKKEFIAKDLHIKICRKAVLSAVEILEKML